MRISAGLLVFRRRDGQPELLIAHPGGPYWAKKDEGAWSIVKGEVDEGEDDLATALREFEEETGLAPPPGPYLPLGEVRQAGGKVVKAWAAEGDLDPEAIVPGTYRVQWPPGSGQWRTFPEVDRVAWVGPDTARRKLNPAQAELVDRLLKALARGEP